MTVKYDRLEDCLEPEYTSDIESNKMESSKYIVVHEGTIMAHLPGPYAQDAKKDMEGFRIKGDLYVKVGGFK